MEDLLRYYPTRGGLVLGKSKRAEHPHLEKMPDYRPEEELDFLPILDPKKTATKDSPAVSSTAGTQASTVVDLIEDMYVLNDEYIFASTYNTTETGDETINLDQIPDEDNESDDEELLYEPEIDDDVEINLTGQIQATLSSTVEFKEYIEDTQNIDGNYKLSENQVAVEELFIGQQWLSKELCRNYLKELALDKNYCMVQVKNKKMKQSYKCKDETCEWKVYCSALNDGQTFECKSGHFIHTCQSYNGITHPLANARWVSKVMLECFKEHPNYKPRDFMTEVKKNHKVEVSYYIAWHAYNLCNEKILGSYEEGYSLLPSLCDEILRENRTNIVKLTTDPINDRFVSLCIAYRASLDGFLLNRPILGLDGCHLTGKYGGTLLVITSLDGNNGLFPIDIYLCQSECKESWIDFMSIVAEELKQHLRTLTFISDRQKGLIEGVSTNFGDVNHFHRYCFQHLYKNFKKLHPGKNLEFLAWRAARSFSEAKPSAPEWFDREPVETWARAYFDMSSKCEHITSNFCEAFNSWILELRKMPIYKLVQKFHLLMMRIFFDREQVVKQMPDGSVVPRVTNIIKKHLYFSHEFTAQPSTKDIWQIFDTKKDISWVVNMERHTCTCNEWQVSGIPCVHAICASLRLRPKTYDQYVHSYMYVDSYRVLYTPSIGPLYDKAIWPKNPRIVKPLKCGRPPGRPRSQRRRDRDEGGSSRKYMCGKCYVYGHNRSTCKGAAAENQELAPATFTGPHVRPDPTTRPPPPPPVSTSADETNASQALRNGPRNRGGGRKRRGGATQPHVPTTTAPSSTTTAPSSTTTAPSSTSAVSPVSPPSESAVPTPRGRGRGSRVGRGGRGNKGGRGVSFAPVPLIITATPVPPVQVAASTTISFGRSVSNSSTTTRGGALRGRGARGRGARGRARGQTIHRRNGRIVGIGMMQDEGPTLAREPTTTQVLNPIPGQDGCHIRGNYGGRGGGLVMRGGGAFSLTAGRGKRPRMMDWFGTPEQWVADEN
ncbi:hypothetical protein MKX03_001742 [Papaver bracteatum]|nr:hypothetical protein MKX03_001742 [Papaver bracteatum]